MHARFPSHTYTLTHHRLTGKISVQFIISFIHSAACSSYSSKENSIIGRTFHSFPHLPSRSPSCFYLYHEKQKKIKAERENKTLKHFFFLQLKHYQSSFRAISEPIWNSPINLNMNRTKKNNIPCTPYHVLSKYGASRESSLFNISKNRCHYKNSPTLMYSRVCLKNEVTVVSFESDRRR